MTTKAQILKDIRKHCLNCQDGSRNGVKNCDAFVPPTGRKCVLYPYRFGTDPSPARKGQKPGNKRLKYPVAEE